MIREGVRRLLLAFGIAALITAGLSLVIGLALGDSIQRSLSIGYMLAGSLVMMIGLGAGMRGFGRPSDDDPNVVHERVGSSALLIAIGASLVFVGIGLDPRTVIF
jgi:hypothetical protein